MPPGAYHGRATDSSNFVATSDLLTVTVGAVAGDAGLVLVVTGSGFFPRSTLLWNGVGLAGLGGEAVRRWRRARRAKTG